MSRLSLAPLTISDAGPLELIEAAAAGGFDEVGVRLLPAPATRLVTPILGNEPLIRVIAQRLADTGRTVFAATGIFLDAATAPDHYRPALAIAARLGARFFLAVGYDADPYRLAENLARLCDDAATEGLAIALEFQPYSTVRTIEQAHAVVHRAARPNGAILVDALHLRRSGGTPAAVAKIAPERIAYVQLCDATLDGPGPGGLRAEALTGRLLPGDGSLPLIDLMTALPPDVAIDVEAPVRALAHLPPNERAKRVGDATRRFLDNYRNARG